MKSDSCAIPLVILDVQDAIDQPAWDGKNNPDYLAVIQRLLEHWRRNEWLILHIKHNELEPTSTYYTHGPWNGIKKEVTPLSGETIITKQQNCAFINTELDDTLKQMKVNRFVLTGVVIHNSMDATVRAGKALGYNIVLPADATTAVPVAGPKGKSWSAAEVYELTLAILGSEYADIVVSNDLISKLVK